MSALVVVDADVLGRERTGDETYVRNLLARLPDAAGPGLRFAAVTRRPDLIPPGVEPVYVPARSQELRMAWSLPRALRRLRPALGHFQHALPLRRPCPAVVTVHDLSFERDPTAMGRADRLIFRRVVPRAVHAAAHVLAVSERTKADVVELYGVTPDRITVTPHGVDPVFSPGGGGPLDYVLAVGAVQARKDPLAAAEAAREAGLPLVVVGPVRDRGLAEELRLRGAHLHGYVSQAALVELYRGAACLVMPSRYEGFGLPVLEAMACGTPVVVTPDPALVEVAGKAAIVAPAERLAEGIRQALSERDLWVARGIERAAAFSWDETARRTVAVYRSVLGVA